MTARLTIDLSALAHNYRALAREAAGAEVAPVVKANAYGLGVGPVCRRLHAEGARAFFVARLEEGETLRSEMGDRPCNILVLDGVAPGSQPRLLAAGLTPVVNSLAEARAWSGPPPALHVETGMNRLGAAYEEAAELARSGYGLSLVMAHLGAGNDANDPRTVRQLERFRAARALFPNVRASLAASSGTFLGADFRFDMVRPGISLFGGGPFERPDPHLRAVASMHAPVLAVRDLKAGDQAGYGRMFTATGDMRLAIVGAGYADGVLRAAHRGGYGVVGGDKAPFAIVTMDMVGLDVTGLQVRPGDVAELLGPQALLDDLARAAGTVAHECLVRLGGRGEKLYIGSENGEDQP